MKENQESHVASEGVSPSMRMGEKAVKDAMRKHGAVIALATILLASYALVLTSISDLRADLRTEFGRIDARFERMDARLYELIERVARIEGHLALTRGPAAEKNRSRDENLDSL